MSPVGDSVAYFAYGANLHPGWLRRRIPAAVVVGAGALPGHRIAFRKRGRDGAGRSDAWQTGDPADRLPGALYRLPAGDLGRLGAAGAGYHADEVQIETAAGLVAALTWRADADQLAADLRPWDWYLALIVAGAAIHALPADYRRWLASVPVAQDPDRARAAVALSIIGTGGMRPRVAGK